MTSGIRAPTPGSDVPDPRDDPARALVTDPRRPGTRPPQSFTDVVEIVLQQYEPVHAIPVIVAVASAARDRLAVAVPSAATPAAVLVATRAALDALEPARDQTGHGP